MSTKADRVDHANELIEAIASHGRRFFYSKEAGRTSSFIVNKSGKIWFVDDYSGKAIYTQYSGRWRGFTHGGTLRNLVEMMRDYIRTGERIGIRWIGLCRDDGSNIWGYDEDAIFALRREVEGMPIICEG